MADQKRGFKKGWEGGPGRPTGSKNKVTVEVKQALMYVFKNMLITEVDDKTGKKKYHKGRDALLHWANKNPTEFITKLLPKLLPKPVEVSGLDGEKITQNMFIVMPEKTLLPDVPGEKIVYDPEIEQIELDEEED